MERTGGVLEVQARGGPVRSRLQRAAETDLSVCMVKSCCKREGRAGVKHLVFLPTHKRIDGGLLKAVLGKAVFGAAAAGFALVASAAMTGAVAEPGAHAALLAQHNPFSTLVGERRRRPDEPGPHGGVERYVLASDERMFLFEDEGAAARIRFLCGADDKRLECAIDPGVDATEIYLLEATRAPRGDVVYRNASGDVLLRIASYGGATVYWPGDPEGRAASKSFGDNPRLELVYTDFESAQRRARMASAMLSAKTGAPIIFDLGAPAVEEGANTAVLADAVVTVAKGLSLVSRDPTGAQVVASRINRVLFAPAAGPGVSLRGSTLHIGYQPVAGLEGRPSSAAVARYLEENL